MLIHLKSCEVYAPEYLGRKDVLTGGGKIIAVADSLPFIPKAYVKEIDCRGMKLLPAFIDAHVHIAGGEMRRILSDHCMRWLKTVS